MSTEKHDQITAATEGCAAAAGYAVPPEIHTYSRWDYQDDRHDLMRWINSKRTSKALDWRWDGQRLTIMVEPSRHRRRWYQIDAVELDLCSLGWRWLVARAIKECRRALRHTPRIRQPRANDYANTNNYLRAVACIRWFCFVS